MGGHAAPTLGTTHRSGDSIEVALSYFVAYHRVRHVFYLLALTLTSVLPAQAPVPGEAEEVYRATAPSVFLIELRDEIGKALGMGSGFLIRGSRIVTNAHVVRGGTPYLRTGAVAIPLTVERLDADNDLAILQSATPLEAQPLSFAVTVPTVGATVYAIGNPQGLERTISQGLVSGNRRFRDRDLMQITASISPGSSGGPVVDRNGRVVGVTVGYLEDGQNLNFAIPSAHVVALLEGTLAFLAATPREATELVTEFLGAVNRWDLTTMAELWGTANRGPASRHMEPRELLRRLIVIAAYLGHDSLRVLSEHVEADGSRRSVRVRLMRGRASSTVPFTLAHWPEGGLLIEDVHLEASDGLYNAAGARPQPMKAPRPSVTGSYYVALLARDTAKRAFGNFGAMHLGKQVGVLKLPWEGVTEGRPAVWFASSIRTSARGQVAVEIGGIAYDGFQTDSGVYLEGTFRSGTGEAVHTSLVGFLYAAPLSVNDGLYRVKSQTDYYPSRGRRPSGKLTNWTGELAVAVAGDSIWVDMHLVNDVGGSVLFRAWGQTRDSDFDLVSHDGDKRMKGRLRNGVLVAEWTDRRDGARFHGTIAAERF